MVKTRTKEWDVDLVKFITTLQRVKPVILGGDLGVAHEDIDAKPPKVFPQHMPRDVNEQVGSLLAERHNFGKML